MVARDDFIDAERVMLEGEELSEAIAKQLGGKIKRPREGTRTVTQPGLTLHQDENLRPRPHTGSPSVDVTDKINAIINDPENRAPRRVVRAGDPGGVDEEIPGWFAYDDHLHPPAPVEEPVAVVAPQLTSLWRDAALATWEVARTDGVAYVRATARDGVDWVQDTAPDVWVALRGRIRALVARFRR